MRSLLVAAAAAALLAAPAEASSKRRYNTAASRVDNPSVLNVHIICHTHDDVGWLKTVDQYFYGANNTIQHANVNSIISATLAELTRNPDRKFSYVEQAFFQAWWENADEADQETMRRLVASGQMQFINGGWCMHDEASPSFVDMVDQTTLGARWIYEEFGVQPTMTWQIDPFGHSAFQAYAMSSPMSGYNSVFFARADYQDIAARKAANATEFYWAPSPSLGDKAATLGGILADYYYPPSGLNFGGDDGTQPVMDDPNLEDYNVDQVVDLFLGYAQQWSGFTRGNDVMMMMGTDFSYENAVTWFRNLDKLIHYVNLNTSIHGVNVFYSTPAEYAKAKIQSTPLPPKTDDMFPYADGPHAVWAGYFTSRPALKGYIRETSSYHQAARQMQFFGAPPADLSPSNPLYLLERAVGITQHHDAVSGTSKQHVAYDYALKIAEGRTAADALAAQSMAALTGYQGAPFLPCDLTNATICPALEAGVPTLVGLWNSQGQARTGVPVRIPIGLPAGTASYAVYGPDGAPITAQLLPLSAADSSLRSQYYGYNSAVAVSWLAFLADIPAAGYAVFFLQPAAAAADAPATVQSGVRSIRGKALRDSQLSNGIISLTFSASTGRLTGFSNAANGISLPLSNEFFWYNSSTGNAADDGTFDYGQQSGAYIFRPNSSTPFPVSTAAVRLTLVTGPVVNEARQTWGGSWVSQVVRLWANASTVDFEYTVGPIPFADGNGKEVIARYTTPLASNGTWYSDTNGRDSMRRQRNARPSWDLNVTEPIADNYVPVNLFQWLTDGTQTLSIVTDRSMGGSSMADGSLEFMVHRRLLQDDGRGVGEPLNETGIDGNGLIIRGMHTLSLDPVAAAGRVRRTTGQNLLYRPAVTYAAATGAAAATPSSFFSNFTASFSGLSAPLPPQLHLLTVHAHSDHTLLLRLSHSYEVGEDAVLSQNATVSLASLFQGLPIASAEEFTLIGNQPLARAPKVTYMVDGGDNVTLPFIPAAPAGPTLDVTLNPMEIRTFFCELA